MRPIDADTLVENIESYYIPVTGFASAVDAFEANRMKLLFLNEIDTAPTLDPVPVRRGWWVEEKNRSRHWHCSECGTVQGITSVSMNYCPACGVLMYEHPWAASGCGQTFCPGKDE